MTDIKELTTRLQTIATKMRCEAYLEHVSKVSKQEDATPQRVPGETVRRLLDMKESMVEMKTKADKYDRNIIKTKINQRRKQIKELGTNRLYKDAVKREQRKAELEEIIKELSAQL